MTFAFFIVMTGVSKIYSVSAIPEISLFDQAEGYVEKGIVTTLFVLDKFSFVSPIRWFFPTTSWNGQKLEGGLIACGGDEVPSPSQPDPPVADIPVYDKEQVPSEKTPEKIPENPSVPPVVECKPGNLRPCGPCELGSQICGTDYLWEAACHYTADQLTRPCYTGPLGTSGVGECRLGIQSCAGGQWGACENEITPRAEGCDGKDNDCDGFVDDHIPPQICYDGPAVTQGIGICRTGMQRCVEGVWGNCENEVTPSPEICDGIDNNCDGQADETGCGRLIGDPCRLDTGTRAYSHDCVSSFCIGPNDYSGGYCTALVYSENRDEECPAGENYRQSVCVQNSQLGVDTFRNNWHLSEYYHYYYCVVTCEEDADCRTREDYLCKPIIGSALKACLPQYEEVNIGTGACAE